MASLFQRGKRGTWWIKYYADGRQVYRSLKTIDARAAKRVKHQIEGEEANGELRAPSNIPLPEFLQDFCQFLSTIRTPKSYANDVSVLRIFFGPVCPALELGTHVNVRWRSAIVKRMPDTMVAVHVHAAYLEQVTASRIEQFIFRRLREDGIAPKTANRCREVLHRMFTYATRHWGFIAPGTGNKNPASLVERRPEPIQTIRYLQQEQIRDQLDALADVTTIQAMVAVYIYAGLRWEEVLWLTGEDVDLQRRLVGNCADATAAADTNLRVRRVLMANPKIRVSDLPILVPEQCGDAYPAFGAVYGTSNNSAAFRFAASGRLSYRIVVCTF